MTRLITVVVWGWAIAWASAVFAANDGVPTLKEAFADDFLIGAALSADEVKAPDAPAMKLAIRQFNTITPENLLKWAEVHPHLDKYDFAPADRYVEFGQKHGMFIVGHTLVWHNQTPAWVFEGDDGKPVDRETLLARMRDHIHTVVGRYKGRVGGWDVVNEAINSDGSMRATPWRQIIGDDYIAKAFEFAHEADPEAELYYNDYDMWKPGKRRAVKQLVKDLRAKGIRIDGVGIQAHWGMDYPSLDETEAMLSDYGELGMQLMITELDMNVLPRPSRHQGADIRENYELRKELDPYPEGLPAEQQRALAERYADIFRVFLQHRDAIGRVTFWGVDNGQSWLNNWPVKGRTNYPLLFDRDCQPTAAFNAVIDVAKGQR